MQDLLAPSVFTITRITGKELLLKDKYFMLTTNMFRLIKLSFKSYIKNKKQFMRLPKDYLLIASSIMVPVLSLKRNNTTKIRKNGSHFLQR